MVSYEEMLSKVANQVKIDESALSARAEQVLASEGAGWTVVGKTEEECKVLALRVAARQLTSEKAKLTRSGATIYEGMFVYTPRYKDWADMAYKKMKNTLSTMEQEGRIALVSQGALYLYENNHDGTYTRHANDSLLGKRTFEEGFTSIDVDSLPNRVYELDGNTHFCLVWDKANMTFANGNDNFKYGEARPLNEFDRTCLFAGRKEGDNGMSIVSVRLQGELAKTEFPTFVTGKIALKAAMKADTAYGTKVTSFVADESVSEIFPSPPLSIDGGEVSGFLMDAGFATFLPSIEKCVEDYEKLDQKEKWDAIFGTVAEVVHIDPRENGGFVVSVADSDIMSSAPVVDIYVHATHEAEVDFSVGSELVILGSPWMTREGEARFSVNAWWCMNAIRPVTDEDGWGAE